MSEKLKDMMATEAKSTRAVAQDIVMSGAYLYPFKVRSYAFPGLRLVLTRRNEHYRVSSFSQLTKTYGVHLSLALAEL